MSAADYQSEVAWSSYMPALGAALAKSTPGSSVLEFGMGHFSSPFLHEYCSAAKRTLLSVEENQEWREQFETHMQCGDHWIFPHPEALPAPTSRFGVVFIDSSPGGDARAAIFKQWARRAEWVVVHDFWKENAEAIAPLLEAFHPKRAFRFQIFSRYQPPTLLASAYYDL